MSEINFTSLFLPDWCRKLFVETFVLTRNRCDSATLIGRTKFLPLMPVAQLKALIHIIDSLQRQLLISRQDNITLSCGSKERHLLSALATARLLCPHTTRTRSCPFFNTEVWGQEFTSLQLYLSPYGRELLLGYCDPYADLVRLTKGEIQLGQLGHRAPLHLWKSIWSDIQGWEQLIYLRLEEATQHATNWINLNHSISQSLSRLTAGLTCKKTAMRVISSLGKKLTEHGHLSSIPSSASIFLENKGGTQLMWTLQRSLDIKKHRDIYLKAAYSCFLNTQSVLTDLITLLCPDQRSVAHKLRQEFTALFAIPDFTCEVLTMLAPNSPLFDISLFYEWCLRSLGATLPLPAEFSGSEATNAVTPRNAKPLVQRFKAFREYWREHSDLIPVLTTEPMVCVASICSRQSLPDHLHPVSNLPSRSESVSALDFIQHTDDDHQPAAVQSTHVRQIVSEQPAPRRLICRKSRP